MLGLAFGGGFFFAEVVMLPPRRAEHASPPRVDAIVEFFTIGAYALFAIGTRVRYAHKTNVVESLEEHPCQIGTEPTSPRVTTCYASSTSKRKGCSRSPRRPA